MKRNRIKWFVLGGLVLLAASGVLADYNVLDKSTYKQNASTGLRVTSDGHLTTAEQSPQMDANLTFSSVISLSTLAAGAGDSSAVLDTHRMRLGTLLIKATPQGGDSVAANSQVRLGIQIRTHLQGASDSMSVFPFYLYGRSDQGAVTTSAAQFDTAAAGQIFYGVNLGASANAVHSGEYVVVVDGRRRGPGGAAIVSRTWSYPNGIALPLSSIFGRDLYSPYTSIRVRNLGNGGAANLSCIVTVSLVGTPL